LLRARNIARIPLPRNLERTPMLALTEVQLLAIDNAARALHPVDRQPFYAAVAAELQGYPMIGDGTVARAIRMVQPRFSHPEPERTPARWAR
jgi:hypothetical protein